jgi:predicted transcriptional regulator
MTSNAGSPKTVTLKIASLNEALQDFKSAWSSGKATKPSIAFASWDLMHKTLSPRRIALVKALRGHEPISIRELARRVERDFKGVHTDVVALIRAGIVDKQENKISFPYEGLHIEFDIDAAA